YPRQQRAPRSHGALKPGISPVIPSLTREGVRLHAYRRSRHAQTGKPRLGQRSAMPERPSLAGVVGSGDSYGEFALDVPVAHRFECVGEFWEGIDAVDDGS